MKFLPETAVPNFEEFFRFESSKIDLTRNNFRMVLLKSLGIGFLELPVSCALCKISAKLVNTYDDLLSKLSTAGGSCRKPAGVAGSKRELLEASGSCWKQAGVAGSKRE